MYLLCDSPHTNWKLRWPWRLVSTIFVFKLACLWSATCHAATATSETSLRELLNLSFDDLLNVTISSRTSRKLSNIPSTVYVYTQEEIRKHGWTSLAELIQHVPGVDVVNKHPGVTLSVRGVGDLGFHGRKTVIMIDGHNMAFSALGSPGFGGFMNQYDIFNAKRVEILIGPGGTLHGANAFGIVIDIKTKTPEEINGVGADMFYGTQGEYIPSLRFGKQFDKWGFFQSFTLWRQSDSELSEVAISKNPDDFLVVYDNENFESLTTKNYDIHGYADYDKRFRLGYRFSKVDSTRGTSLISTQAGVLKVDQSFIYFDWNQPLTQRLRYTLKSHYKTTEHDEDESYFVDTTRNIVGSLDLGSESLMLDNQFTFEQDDTVTWVGGLFYEYSK